MVSPHISNHHSNKKETMERIEVLKTYKLYIGGQFPRTESGRYYQPEGRGGKKLGNICQSSRKDFRNAVVAARSALGKWAPRDPFNRSQILYRIAEMLEGRSAQFIDELKQQGATAAAQECFQAYQRTMREDYNLPPHEEITALFVDLNEPKSTPPQATAWL